MTRLWQRISTNRPRLIIGLSVLVIILLGWYGFGLFNNLASGEDMSIDGTESKEVTEVARQEFGAPSNGQIILFESNGQSLGAADSPEFQAEMQRLLEPLQAETSSILTYQTTGSDSFISHEKTASYAVVSVEDTDSGNDSYQVLRDFADSADQSKLSVSVGGMDALNAEMGDAVSKELLLVELISLPILLILLLLFFRSPVAALIPVGIAIFTVIGGLAVTRLISNFVVIDVYAVNIITILGIGLSIDYALLSVNRFREELPHGVASAVKKVIATSGHTIFFSGITVMACLLALFVFPIELMKSIAVGGAAAVAIAVSTTYIVLPSVLMLLGPSIDKGRPRRKRKAGQDHIVNQSSLWYRIASLTTRHPVVSFVAGLSVVALAIIPLVQFQPAGMTSEWLARNIESAQVTLKLDNDFDSSSTPAIVLAKVDNQTSYADKIDLSCSLTKQIESQDNVTSVQSAAALPDGLTCDNLKQMHSLGLVPPELQAMLDGYIAPGAVILNVFFDDNLNNAAKESAMLQLRDLTNPNADILVGGAVAEVYDMNQTYYQAAPIAIAIIAISMVVLLSIALRSIVVPIQAIITNTLGLAISMAIIVGTFQLGWFSDFTGWPQIEGIALTAPLLFGVIAFGLSMDYSVFLFSRMREVYNDTGDSKLAVRVSITKTGPIITAAAMAFFVVVAGLTFSSTLMMQIIGLGLAIAVVVDAFFVRLILVPALMMLLGKFGWK